MTFKMLTRAVTTVAFAASCAMLASPASAQNDLTRVVAVSGDPAPGGDGVFAATEPNPRTFWSGTASIDNAGSVTFWASLNGNAGREEGVFRGDGIGALTEIARSGQAAPDGNGRYLYFQMPSSSKGGQVAFEGILTGATGGLVRGGVYRSDGAGVTEVLRDGRTPAGGGGAYFAFDPINAPAVNDAGQVAFHTSVTGTAAEYNTIVRGDGAALTQVVREGQAALDVPGDTIARIGRKPSMNAAGQVAFQATLGAGERIYLGDGATLTPLARTSAPVPSGNGQLGNLFTPTLNDAGQVAFQSNLIHTSGGAADDQAIVRADGNGMTVIARKGQVLGTVLDHHGQPMDVLLGDLDAKGYVGFNNAGQAVFRTVEGAVYRGDGGPLVAVALNGQAAPGGNGHFAHFDVPAINEAGQLAFRANLEGTAGANDNLGLFFFDDRYGLLEIARTGDAYLGSTLAFLDVYGSNAGLGSEMAINDRGQVAYSFWLADGRYGVAVWTVPEPSAGALVLAAAAALLRWRRNH